MSFAHFFQHLPWITIFGFLGNAISFMVFLSPIPTFYNIYKKKSTEGFQSIPYVVALFSAMLWLFYAHLKRDVIFLVTINSFGLFIESIYLAIYLIYANNDARVWTLQLLGLFNVFGFGVIVFFVMVVAKTTTARLLILGWVCVVFSFCVFVAPLGVMRQVIKTKSVKYMPFFLSFFLTISAVVWFFYGLLRKDFNVAVPNVLGFTFGILQMGLYAMYRESTPAKERTVTKNEISITELIVERSKTTNPNSTDNNDNNDDAKIVAIEIPNLNMINNNNPINNAIIDRIRMNHTPIQIAVAV